MLKPEVKWLMEYLDEREIIPEMDKCMNLIMHWLCLDYYESKKLRLEEWNPDKQTVYGILSHILIGLFMNREMTYQAVIGLIANDFNHEDKIDRFKTAAEVIAIAYQCDLIVITKNEDYMMITTEFELDEDLPDFEHHKPEAHPYVAEYNQILGCRFKQHQEDTCISHINTMNSIPLVLEWRVIDELRELAKNEEIEATTEWKDFKNRSRRMYEEIDTDTFYLKHFYDTRGRTYCQGYLVNYQGTSYKKSIVQLANKELI